MSHGHPQRGELGKREIHEDHLAQEHVQTEVAEHTREQQAGRERGREQVDHGVSFLAGVLRAWPPVARGLR